MWIDKYMGEFRRCHEIRCLRSASFLGCRLTASSTINQTCRQFICEYFVVFYVTPYKVSEYQRCEYRCVVATWNLHAISSQSREVDAEKWIHLLLYGLLLHKHVLETAPLRRHITTPKYAPNIFVTLRFVSYFILWIIQPMEQFPFAFRSIFDVCACFLRYSVFFSSVFFLLNARNENWNVSKRVWRVQCLRWLSNIPATSNGEIRIPLKCVRVMHRVHTFRRFGDIGRCMHVAIKSNWYWIKWKWFTRYAHINI